MYDYTCIFANKIFIDNILVFLLIYEECDVSVVVCLTPDLGVVGSSLTGYTAWCL